MPGSMSITAGRVGGSSADGTRQATRKVTTHSSGVGPGVAVIALSASLR